MHDLELEESMGKRYDILYYAIILTCKKCNNYSKAAIENSKGLTLQECREAYGDTIMADLSSKFDRLKCAISEHSAAG